MSDGGAAFQPGADEARIPFRPRGVYAGYRAFGSGDGAVLVTPEAARRLRAAAESAAAERHVTGGLLYGCAWADEQGAYLVIDGYLDARPARNDGERAAGRGAGDFALSGADLRLLREEAARMYPADLEAGWWRTRAALGGFGPKDFALQAELVGPGGVGLLVFGSGVHWGTAYLGPAGLAPDSAGTLVAAVGSVPGPGLEAGPEPGPAAEPELADIAAGEGLAKEPLLVDPGPGPAAPYTIAPWRRARGRAVRDDRWPRAPGDARFAASALTAGAAAVVAGLLTSSALVAVIVAVAGFLVVSGGAWMSRR